MLAVDIVAFAATDLCHTNRSSDMQINSKYCGYEKHIHHDHVHCTAYVVHAIHFSHEEEYKFSSLFILGLTTTRLSQKYLDESVKCLPHSCHQSDFYYFIIF